MRTIVITGSSGGIGSEIVRDFASNNWKVIAVDQEPEHQKMAGVTYMGCDLADIDSVKRLLSKIKSESPIIEALVNCAAVQNIGAVTELLETAWDHTFAVNVRAPWMLMKGLHDNLVRAVGEGGYPAIINISSIHAVATSPGMVAYATSKAALNGLTRSVSIEYAKGGIRVNTVVPGAVATPMLVDHLDEAEIDKLLSRQLVPHLIDPSAIVGAIKYLLSPVAANITGQELVIDSGVLPQLATEMA